MKKGVDGETKYTHMTPLEDKDLLKPDFSVLIKKKFFFKGGGRQGRDIGLLSNLLNVVERKLIFVEHLALSQPWHFIKQFYKTLIYTGRN